MQYKQTNKLFFGKYQYKIVLVCAGAGTFRSRDWDEVLANLNKVDLQKVNSNSAGYGRFWTTHIRTQEDLDYAFNVHKLLSKMEDIELRIESPWISLYTNTSKNVDRLIKLDKTKVKYVSVPPSSASLNEETIIMPKIDFEFRVTLGKTSQEHSTFINWADGNSKIKLTKSCRRDLGKARSWGGTYFYVTGEKNLLLSKMHLGGSISKVERIVKA